MVFTQGMYMYILRFEIFKNKFAQLLVKIVSGLCITDTVINKLCFTINTNYDVTVRYKNHC